MKKGLPFFGAALLTGGAFSKHEDLRRERLNGASDVPGEEKNVVSVFLTCISWGKVEEIHDVENLRPFSRLAGTG